MESEGTMASSHRRGADDQFPGHGRMLDEECFHLLRSGEDDRRRMRRVVDGAGVAAANAEGGKVDGYDDDDNDDGGPPPPLGAEGGSRGEGGKSSTQQEDCLHSKMPPGLRPSVADGAAGGGLGGKERGNAAPNESIVSDLSSFGSGGGWAPSLAAAALSNKMTPSFTTGGRVRMSRMV